MTGLAALVVACTPDPSGGDGRAPAPAPTVPDPADTGAEAPCVERTWYVDRDGDGLGGPDSLEACEQPLGTTADAGDCDDLDPDLHDVLDPIHLVHDDVGLLATGPSWTGLSVCAYDAQGGGGAVGDADGDGDLDVFLARQGLEDLLLLNDGTGSFGAAPGWIGDTGGSNGGLFVDVDGDRDLDLWVTRMGADPDLLYVNDGTGVFTDEAAARGLALHPGPLCAIRFGQTATDLDGDGDLDLLVAGWQEEALLGLSQRTRLMLNDGTGRFTDGTLAAGLDLLWQRAVYGMLAADRDGDGDVDLHVVADWEGSGLFLNDGGRFAEAQGGVYTDENGMGGDLADLDGDGDLDWFVTAIWETDRPCSGGWGCSGNRLYLDDDGRHVDGTDLAGVREGQWGWGTAAFDADLDGDLDLALTGGLPATGFEAETGRLFRNRGDGTFDDATCGGGWVARGQGRSIVPFDADRDGDLDLLRIASTEPPTLWRTVGPEDRGWITVELDQPGPNRFAIGAVVTVADGGGEQVRLLSANPLYLAGRPPEVTFGLGDRRGAVEVRVRWPDGVETVHPDTAQGSVRITRP